MPNSTMHLSESEVVTLARCLECLNPFDGQIESVLRRSEQYRNLDADSIRAVVVEVARIWKESGKL